jgi:hypothetical protein
LVGIVDRVSNSTADLMWNLAFNKRLQTQGLGTLDVYNLAHQRNLSFAGLFELPEQVGPGFLFEGGANVFLSISFSFSSPPGLR